MTRGALAQAVAALCVTWLLAPATSAWARTAAPPSSKDRQARPTVGSTATVVPSPGVAAGGAAAPGSESVEPPLSRVHLVRIDGSINPASADFIREALNLASREAHALVLIELDTPGGLLESAKSIVKDLLGATVPVIVYVAPSGAGATSAGVFVTMAAHVAVMAPGTNIGAAHPVGGQGEDIQGEMGKKVENFTASLSKSIAAERGRNVEWAESAVRSSVSITADEAVALGVVDYVASSREELLRKLEGREVKLGERLTRLRLEPFEIVVQEMRLKQRLLNVLADPNVAYLLMMAGLLGLYVEFTNPGLLFPGVAGGICLVLALTASQVLPMNYSGLALLALAIVLLVAELFVPSFGTLGVGGIVAFVLGSLLLFDTSESDLDVNPAIVYAAAATFGVFSLLISYLVVRTHRRPVALGADGLVGEVGEVRQRIPGGAVAGKILVHGELWNATATSPLDVGERVQVVTVTGLRLGVARVKEDGAASVSRSGRSGEVG